jgi:hypothetical protein
LRVRNQSLLPEVSGEAVSFQVNNLRPEITSLDAAGTRDGQGRPVLAIIGPGTEPVSVSFTINGSNFHPAAADPAAQDPGTVAFITLKIPDLFPALVPANGINQCVIVNSRGVLGVTVFDISGNPAPGVTVTFTAPGIDSVTASGFFPPTNASTVTAVSDAQGFASVLFQANPFSGSYPVTAKATVGGIPLQTAIVMTNANPGEGCPNPVAKIVVVSSTQIIVTGFAINQKGVYSVVVANNSPGGGVSSAKEFVVAAGVAGGVPAIRSTDPLSPATRPAGSSTFNLTVYRDSSSSVPFQSDAWVNFGTVRLNRIAGDSDSIVVQVPDFLIASPGLVPISVTNPGTGGNTGGTSGRVYFTVQ